MSALGALEGTVDIVKVRFFIDPESGDPHLVNHDVSEQEVRSVLSRALEDRLGREGSRVAPSGPNDRGAVSSSHLH